ncbi:RtcB family protein [bacterium]|nr:RtcB family protein [bacterium]
MQLASRLVADAGRRGTPRRVIRRELARLLDVPSDYPDEGPFAELAAMIVAHETTLDEADPDEDATTATVPHGEAPWRRWGDDIDPAALGQMHRAASLPVAIEGALMPDAHLGYGLPIGGVLATENAVIPYAVGMDIGCRMKLSVLDLGADALTGRTDDLGQALERETSFGGGAGFERRRAHRVLDRGDWQATPFLAGLKDRAWYQLGSSGRGNHFVEFGVLTLDRADLGLAAGRYLALLSHSGSRHAGLQVARRYSEIARRRHPELPRHLAALAWLDLDSAEGQEYWHALELMGAYAAANHDVIHRHVLARLGAERLAMVENHHNFAWREEHGGRELIVHRKGATPAHADQLGVIPGSMATPGFVVRGLGNPDALSSAAHGAGRRMSRHDAKRRSTWREVRQVLEDHGVTLLSAGLDEGPHAYKDIRAVMAAQSDLVEIVARFEPRIVKMSS